MSVACGSNLPWLAFIGSLVTLFHALLHMSQGANGPSLMDFLCNQSLLIRSLISMSSENTLGCMTVKHIMKQTLPIMNLVINVVKDHGYMPLSGLHILR